ncbi:copper homeostasis protein [Pustulibacterium marinum]|uniref:PF03932 family protein CutC n=1 Tax=Pustulibacterium marinum TaxID=1224947 RepID=A0A1I7GSE9_9FLAO|nr:copper homeostasis protein CutC [Pustulibacterium marinum]SFU51372.1 copper homeostasis protein [Pustulibacterium marinum]
MIKEACVETLQQAINAQRNDVNRIELCGRLDLDGLTPDIAVAKEVVHKLDIPIHVMIRPRGGDFVYTLDEILEMETEIEQFKSMGIDGVVLGVLTKDGEIDTENLERLVAVAKPLNVVFHKAFDELSDLKTGLQQLMNIDGITHVLTSGGCATASEGSEILKDLVKIADGKIQIISAGKITDRNINELHTLIDGEAYHGKLIVGSLE